MGNTPFKMKGFSGFGNSPAKQKKSKKVDIIGEDTLEGKIDKKGNTQRDINTSTFTSDIPEKSKLVTTPKQEGNLEKSGPKSGFIEQFQPMTVSADSTKSDTTYYSIKGQPNKRSAK